MTAAVASADSLARLQALGSRLDRLLEGVPLRWSHGDLWPQNLLVQHGRLTGVVDWDSAVRWSPPLWDLLALTPPGARPAEPGPRTFRQLWPLLRPDQPQVHRYCAEIGLDADTPVLQALAVAYWLDRTKRDLAPFRWNSRRPGWTARNVLDPLAQLDTSGWTAVT
jgi:aminoglycoside phosphotransferase (APT) family kinase protein